jgi:hypothetical protein
MAHGEGPPLVAVFFPEMPIMRKAVFTAITTAFLAAGLTGTAMAADDWTKEHPRRAEVDHRLANQERRISEERREGEITKAEAKKLRSEDRAIRHEERGMAAMDHGHITKAEQRALNQQENAVSREIGH